MSKYHLIGDFTATEVTSSVANGQTIVRIPFLSDDFKKQHGICRAIDDLKKANIYPNEFGFDIITLATLVYLADTRISRSYHAQDNWTREIKIEIPVFNLVEWSETEGLFAKILNFLTGDIWELHFTKREVVFAEEGKSKASFDAVSLFSGGMDSLTGTINHLEQQHSIALVSHAGEGFTKNAQSRLLQSFKAQYPNLNPVSLNLWMVFSKNIIPQGGIENTTRSRSFLFFAFGLFALSGMDGISSLDVPENALIALNVPLDDLRIGSHSTRTTHPYYMNLWNEALNKLGLSLRVANPYWNKTKGEMANECRNKDYLLTTMMISNSCSSPLKARWAKQAPQHCGYCVPCLIRRAAMHKAYGFQNDTTTYTINSIHEIIDAHAQKKGEQLRSFQFAINKVIKNPKLKTFYIHKSGRLDGDDAYLSELADVYYRGLVEVDDFIKAHLAAEEKEME